MIAPEPLDWAVVYRESKPGRHVLAKGKYDVAVALEDAGFEIRDCIRVLLPQASETWWLARKPLEGTVASNVLKYGVGALNIDGCRIRGNVDEMRGRSGGALAENEIYGKGLGQDPDTIWEPSTRGRWPANLVLMHGNCVLRGTKKVVSDGHYPAIRNAAGLWSGEGGGLNGTEDEERYTANADGMETVEDWACEESCPVAEMDRQSGNLIPRSNVNPSFSTKKSEYLTQNSIARNSGPEYNYGDSGGASRFFYRAKSRSDLLEYFARLVGD